MNENGEEENKPFGSSREEWEERIVAVLLGEADAEEEERVRRAVDRDPSLAGYRERMRRVIDTARSVHAEGAMPSGDAASAGVKRLSDERRRRLERLWRQAPDAGRSWGLRGWKPFALAAGLLLLLGGTAYFANFREAAPVLVQQEGDRASEVEEPAGLEDRAATAPAELGISGQGAASGRGAFADLNAERPPEPEAEPEGFGSDILRDADGSRFQWAGAEFSSIGEVLMTPEGGRLDAFDEKGQSVGPVPLKYTDVDVRVSGHFTRVNVTQRYQNPYDHKIEAVYTFPLSHRGAVDRMTMTVGNRVVIGEVKERGEARRVYEAARQQGHVTSLLEQERANIFTQSVANIEPGAEVIIEIRYVEVLDSVDGEYRFDFPTVVAPRYTPGRPIAENLAGDLPDDVLPRRGVILPAPARIEGTGEPVPDDPWLRQYAVPVEIDSPVVDLERREREDPRVVFTAEYGSGERERGVIFPDGVGHVGFRWFYCPPRFLPAPGEPFAMPTDEVPDADRVTPMPVRPDQRAGHDLDIRVTIDTGGPGIRRISSVSHEIECTDAEEGAARASVSLAGGPSLPNRDFRLAWRLESDEIEEAFLTHTGGYGDIEGGFFTLILQPPARVADEDVRPRELIFVLDQSGSMSGTGLADRSALDAAKDVINRSIETMRPNDRFNIVSFNNTLDVLWPQSRENIAENRALARRYIDARQGGGGTEMRNAVLRALRAAPFERAERDADAEGDDPMRIVLLVTDGLVGNDDAIIQAVRNQAHQTRVFAIGMSHSPNRNLLDEMARAGRGAVDYVLPEDDVEPIVQRFADRIATPVLTDIELDFGEGLEVADVLPSTEQMTDLFDVGPLVIHGRYTTPGEGTLTIRGRTGAGPYERNLDITFPEVEPGHDVIATLWAREKVGELMREGGEDVRSFVRLGENFQIVTRHTSFVAVERQRVTIDGEPVLVRVPIEFPKGMSWKGIFGTEVSNEELVRHLRRVPDDVSGLGDLHLGATFESVGRYAYYAERPAAVRAPRQGQMFEESVEWVPAEAEPVRPSLGRAFQRDGLGVYAGGAVAFREPVRLQSHFGNEGRSSSSLTPPSDLLFEEVSRSRGRAHPEALPHGVHIVILELPGTDPEGRVSRLRELLHGRGDGAEALVRVVHDESANAVVLVVPERLVDVFEPFAAKIGAGREIPDEERSAEWDRMMGVIEARVPDLRRDAELYRRLDERLYERLMAVRVGEERDEPGGNVEVVVLLSDLAAATLANLEQAGLEHKATAEGASFVIGSVPVERLESVALLDPVRRIEPVSIR